MSKQETEYKIKSNPQTMPYPLGAYLKWENTPHTREQIDAPEGTKLGDIVDYAPRGSKLIALSDERDGKVVVQPYHCVIELASVNPQKLSELGDDGLHALITLNQAYGVKYQSAPELSSDTYRTEVEPIVSPLPSSN